MRNLKVKWVAWILSTAMVAGFVGYQTAQAEDHNPRIHHALDALREAEQELRDAPQDFHGHKQDAVDAIEHAIQELDRIKDW